MSDPRIQQLQQLLPQCMLPDWVRLGSRMVRLLRHPHRDSVTQDALIERLLEQAHSSIEWRQHRLAQVPEVHYPPDLPITAAKNDILEAIRNHQVVVIAGETGSGKTTQIPKMCLEAGLGIEARIGCTQPRRVAALSISQRIAEELNVPWGREVGCKIRFDDRSSPETYIKLMTDGILLAEAQGDPLLSDYNALIIDEAHERSLNIDFLLGHLTGLLKRRSDLKVVITSATIDTHTFSKAFGDAPILEVSGRLYPVALEYAPPFNEMDGDSADGSYVEAAVDAAGRILRDTQWGDLLIFMPGERDIRETRDLLEGRFGNAAEIIPLFGRLSAGDQQRVFSTGTQRRIIVATNIAETSLTLPGIRHVIDTGLARISRYNPRTRTKRLPIEPISQSSANQRMGRAGRVQDGFCVRLYSQEDFEDRPSFTMPEIQRANLAEVILRMMAFRLGTIETFPFIQPPAPNAIQAGYKLLQELGALDAQRDLTALGRDLARLPIDPTLGRMLLQSKVEGATRELLILAAGLSIQDPRERPLERQTEADTAHRAFQDPSSDFLSLIRLWDFFQEHWSVNKGQSQRRKFCKTHFLSYTRLREWEDVHHQLSDALSELNRFTLDNRPADYTAIHRSVLSGLLGHVGHRKERNLYESPGRRPLNVFPGSALFSRSQQTPRKGRRTPVTQPKEKSEQQPEWIVAGEVVETSQRFARTLAGIDPEWIAQLAPHLCVVTHRNPHWSPTSGRVLAEEVTTFEGLEIQSRRISYAQVDPVAANEIFIQHALIEEQLLPNPTPFSDPNGAEIDLRSLNARVRSQDLLRLTAPTDSRLDSRFPFLAQNRRIREEIEDWQTRVRRTHHVDLDRALFQFYTKHLAEISSRADLEKRLQDVGDPQWLCIHRADLLDGADLMYDQEAFPSALHFHGHALPLTYAYAPGEVHDGITLNLPVALASEVPSAWLEWAIPGLRESKMLELLRSLPKALRRDLMPLPQKVGVLLQEFAPEEGPFARTLSTFLHRQFGVRVPIEAISTAMDSLPAHLRVRIQLMADDQKPLGHARDLDKLRSQLPQTPTPQVQSVSPAWTRATQVWERFSLSDWTLPNLPHHIVVEPSQHPTHPPVLAWPALVLEGNDVHLRLMRSPQLARTANARGVQALAERVLSREFGWLERDLRALTDCASLYSALGTIDELRADAMTHLKRYLLPQNGLEQYTELAFRTVVQHARERLPKLAGRFIQQIRDILTARHHIAQRLRGIAPVNQPAASSPQKLAAKPRRSLTDLSQLDALILAAPLESSIQVPSVFSTGSVAPARKRPENRSKLQQPVGFVSWSDELQRVLPKDFLLRTDYDQLPHLLRYLKALEIRHERATLHPAKEQERRQQLEPYLSALNELEAEASVDHPLDPSFTEGLNHYRWMLAEYRVSLFAQELGTAIPVSPKRLDQQLTVLRSTLG